MGTCITPAALIVSKNIPSLVLAFPMVPQAISFPFLEKLSRFFVAYSRYTLEACARPKSLGICEPVGEMSPL